MLLKSFFAFANWFFSCADESEICLWAVTKINGLFISQNVEDVRIHRNWVAQVYQVEFFVVVVHRKRSLFRIEVQLHQKVVIVVAFDDGPWVDLVSFCLARLEVNPILVYFSVDLIHSCNEC